MPPALTFELADETLCRHCARGTEPAGCQQQCDVCVLAVSALAELMTPFVVMAPAKLPVVASRQRAAGGNCCRGHCTGTDERANRDSTDTLAVPDVTPPAVLIPDASDRR